MTSRARSLIYIACISLGMITSMAGTASAREGGGSHGGGGTHGEGGFHGGGGGFASRGGIVGGGFGADVRAPAGPSFARSGVMVGRAPAQDWSRGRHSPTGWYRDRHGWRFDNYDDWADYAYSYPIYGCPWPYDSNTCPDVYYPYAYYPAPGPSVGSAAIRSYAGRVGRTSATHSTTASKSRQSVVRGPAEAHSSPSSHKLAHAMPHPSR
jgi:hypothetical protein